NFSEDVLSEGCQMSVPKTAKNYGEKGKYETNRSHCQRIYREEYADKLEKSSTEYSVEDPRDKR
ncbi:MAG: hypothetical protein AAB631_02880, partial [Patescibacteria group bacterium]